MIYQRKVTSGEPLVVLSQRLNHAPSIELEKRWWLIVGDIDRSYCQRCHSAPVMLVPEIQTKGIFRRIFHGSLKQKPLQKMVHWCPICGKVEESETISGVTLINQVMADICKDALREELNASSVLPDLTIEEALDICSIWLAIGLKRTINFGKIDTFAQFAKLILGDEEK